MKVWPGEPILGLALANLVRDRRRTLLTLLPGSAALVALLLLWSFNDSLQDSLSKGFQEGLIGSVQVHAKGFFLHPRLDRGLPDLPQAISALEAAGVSRWTPRLETFALAAGPRTSRGLMLIAIDPEREPRVTRLAGRIGSGRFLRVNDGMNCLLGRGAARNLGVDVGDSIDLITHDRYGAPAGERCELTGILDHAGFGIDRQILFLPLRAARELLDMQGRTTDLVARVPARRLDAVSAQLAAALDPKRYEVLRWDRMFPVLAEWIRIQRGFERFFMGVALLLVAAAVSNVALVAALGRRREFAMMLALGNRRHDLARLLLTESGLLGLAGAGLGLVLGLPLIALLGRHGLDLSSWLGETQRYYLDPVLHPALDLGSAFVLALSVLLITLAAALYPAWRAGHIEPTGILSARG